MSIAVPTVPTILGLALALALAAALPPPLRRRLSA